MSQATDSQRVDETPIVRYSVTDAELVQLKERFQGLDASKDKQEYESVRLAIREVRTLRTDVEKRRKELKKDALEWGRKVDGEAKRITAALLAIEKPLHDSKNLVDYEKERKRFEAEQREKDRLAKIEQAIKRIERYKTRLQELQTPGDVDLRLIELHDLIIDDETYGERAEEALKAKEDTMEFLAEFKGVLETRIKADEELKKRKEREEAELAAARKVFEQEQAAIAKEREKLEAEQREKLAEERRTLDREQKRIAAERAELAITQEADRLKREAEEAEAFAKQQEEERFERNAAEALDRKKAEEEEAKRQAELKPDKERLLDFAIGLKLSVPNPASFTTINGRNTALLVGELLVELKEKIEKLCEEM